VYPGRAVEIKDGFAQRVTSESCLHTLSQNVLDRNTGLLSGENFSRHAFEKAAVGVQVSENSDPNSAACQVHVADDQCIVFVGKLENAQELKKMQMPEASGATNDAALIGHLYKQKDGNKHSYPFLGELKGSFAFALYDATADSCLAARDESGKYMMFQGVDKKTGGLILTNCMLSNANELTEIPAGMFIFGKHRERLTHPINKTRKEPVDVEHTPSKVAARVCALSTDERASLLKRQTEVAHNAADRALSGITPSPSVESLASLISTPPKGRTTPSAKGTADKQRSWKKEPAPTKQGFFTRSESHLTLALPSTSQPSALVVKVSARETTTPSSKGTADRANTWKRRGLPETNAEATPPQLTVNTGAADRWLQTDPAAMLLNAETEYYEDEGAHQPDHWSPRASDLHTSVSPPTSDMFELDHSEMLSQAVDVTLSRRTSSQVNRSTSNPLRPVPAVSRVNSSEDRRSSSDSFPSRETFSPRVSMESVFTLATRRRSVDVRFAGPVFGSSQVHSPRSSLAAAAPRRASSSKRSMSQPTSAVRLSKDMMQATAGNLASTSSINSTSKRMSGTFL